ncbi:MAG: retroviral-like aspartic protease family protein [Chloroflexota bacterium]
MTATYDTSYVPAAPVAEFRLAPPGQMMASGPHVGLIDTGADICIVPYFLVESLEIEIDSQRNLRAYDGSRRPVDIYVVDIEIAQLRLPAIELVAVEVMDEAIIGRNVLNRLRISLDGPTAVIEIRA